MEIKQNCVFVGVSRYDFKAEDGNQLKGCKVHLIDLSTDKNKKNEDYHGLKVSSFTASYDVFEKLYTLSPLKNYLFLMNVDIDGSKIRIAVLDVLTTEK